MADPGTARPVVVLFAQDRMDARVVKRIHALRDSGWHVLGFTFLRVQDRPATVPDWENVHLGRTWSRRYVQRGLAVLRGLGIVWRHRRRIGEAQCLYAVNADNALLALWAWLVAPGRRPLVLEIADIQPAMTGQGLKGKVLRAVEKFVLRRTALLVTTSPGFVRNWFQAVQRHAGEIFLLENKVYPSAALLEARPAQPRGPAQGGSPWVIGYFGAMRCERSLRIIRGLALRFGERVQFHLRGHFFGARPEVYDELLAGLPNVHFGGAYQYPADLPGMYGAVDLNWCFDWLHAGENSAWLLPNRIYEGGIFGVPCLADASTQTGNWVAEHGAGWTISGDPESALGDLLERLTPEEWAAAHARMLAWPVSHCAGEADYAALSARMQSLQG